MTRYGEIAVNAANYFTSKKCQTPLEAWNLATMEIFGEGTPGQTKPCPKSAFLGLCEEGKVKDIPKGSYTRSKINKEYGLKALEILQNNPSLINNPRELWKKVLKGTIIKHNGQMDVVVALFSRKLIAK